MPPARQRRRTALRHADDVEKAQKLVAQGVSDSYVLMTNAGPSGPGGAQIKALFKAAGVQRSSAARSHRCLLDILGEWGLLSSND
jgi:hypothetical protein